MNKAPVWGLRPDFYYCQPVAGLSMWGALSDERTGLSFTIAPDPRHRSYFRVRVTWDSWPYFTVSDSRLTFSLPPTAREVTVEVFDPASTWATHFSFTSYWVFETTRTAYKTPSLTVLQLLRVYLFWLHYSGFLALRGKTQTHRQQDGVISIVLFFFKIRKID
jgi:hypothetical protein